MERHRHDGREPPGRGDDVRLGHQQGIPHQDRRLRRGRRTGPAAVAAEPRRQGLLHPPALPRVRRGAGPRRAAAAHRQPVRADDPAQLPQRLAGAVVRPALARSARGPRGTHRGRGAALLRRLACGRADVGASGRRERCERRGRRRGQPDARPLQPLRGPRTCLRRQSSRGSTRRPPGAAPTSRPSTRLPRRSTSRGWSSTRRASSSTPRGWSGSSPARPSSWPRPRPPVSGASAGGPVAAAPPVARADG